MTHDNMLHYSSRLGTTSSSSIYGKDFLELVWENGQIHAGRGSSSNNNTTQQNTPFLLQDVSTSSKRAKLSRVFDDHHHFPPPQRDSDLTSSHQSNGMCAYSSSQQHCLPSTSTSTPPFKKPRIDYSTKTPTTTTNSQKQYLVNFSNFSVPAVFLKSTHHRQNSSRIVNASSSPGRVLAEKKIELKPGVASTSTSNKARDHHHQSAAVIESTKEISHAQKSVQVEPPSSSEEALKEEKGKANNNTNLCNERPSSSVCSLGASNNPNCSSIRNHEDTDDSAYLIDDDEETENIVNEKPACEGNNRLERSRNVEIHNLSERKRRDKINEKIRTLKELIPNCNKMDKASMLDDAILYLKTLKLQLEIMSMGRGLCMAPFMMSPHHMNMNMNSALLVGASGMGLRPAGTGISIPCSPPVVPQFPIPQPFSGVTDNRRLQMFGFSNQMPIPNAPFIPIIGNGNYSSQPLINGNQHSYQPARHLANHG